MKLFVRGTLADNKKLEVNFMKQTRNYMNFISGFRINRYSILDNNLHQNINSQLLVKPTKLKGNL